MSTLTKSDFLFKNQISKYEGKVRDVYFLENDILLMIVSDRISAFDVVMPVGITYKGQILNQIAFDMLKSTEDIIDNWLSWVPGWQRDQWVQPPGFLAWPTSHVLRVLPLCLSLPA